MCDGESYDSRATVRVTDNSRLLESCDTRIPENVETITRTADAPRKRASPPQEGPTSRKRQASPPGSPERPTYVRTLTGDTDYNSQPQRVIQEILWDIRVPNPVPLDPPDIVVLPATDCIIDYELQTAAFRAQAAGGGPDPNAAHPTPMRRTRYDHRYHGTYMIVRHRSTYPRYSLPHPVRPLQRW